MKVNNYDVIGRYNRPAYNSRIALKTYFINDGVYADPYEISSVAIYTKAQNTSPSSVLDTSTQLATSTPLMAFGASGETLTTNSNFDESNYSPGGQSSGIYKVGTGEYVVVLDNTIPTSGDWNGSAIPNTASAVNDYIDIWAVKHSAGSNYIIYVNDYTLYDDTFIQTTQRLLLATNSKLITKKLELGSTKNLILQTEITVQNKDIDQSIKNIFKESAILSGAFEIKKLNEGTSLPSQVTVSGFADTSGSMQTKESNELVLNFNTNDLTTLAANTTGFGSPIGAYALRARFTLLDEIIITPWYSFRVD